ncbi:MAG: laccase domain-containing protein, partial [Nitrospinae bacterium]|nr:laccase domain-containing protein [Nitrospinota bacterium]
MNNSQRSKIEDRKSKIKFIVIPEFGKDGGVIHAFSTRHSFNMAFNDHDNQEDVLKNRMAFGEAIGIGSREIVTLKQVHGREVIILKERDSDIYSIRGKEGDAIITNIRELPIAVLIADCLPILLMDQYRRAIAVVHAGRIGTFLRIIQKTIEGMKEIFGIPYKDILAGMGTGIGRCCYELDERGVQPFKEEDHYYDDFINRQGENRYLLDLVGANKK